MRGKDAIMVAMDPLTLMIITLVLNITALAMAVSFIIYWYTSVVITDVPYVPTEYKYMDIIADALELKPGDVLYDIGCGDGRMLLHCGKKQPGATCIGIERNPFLVGRAERLWRRAGSPANVKFVKDDMFTADISDATHIYAYLMKQPMRELFPESRNLKNVRLVSRAFPLAWRKADRTIQLSEIPGSFGQHMVYIYNF